MWLGGGRQLAGNLHENPDKARAVLHSHFIGETSGRILQESLRKLEGSDGDITLTITGRDTTNHPGVAVDAVIAHEAAGCQRGQGQIILRGTLARVRVVLTYEFLQNARGTAQGSGFGPRHRSPHANSQPWAGRGLPVDYFIGQAEIRRQLADFKFEETSQGLNDRDLESRREATDIVVGF